LESIACPIFGATFGIPIAASVHAMVEGFRRGRGAHPAKLVFCEIDRTRYDQLRAALAPETVELRAGAAAPAQASGSVLHVAVEAPPGAAAVHVRVTLYVPEIAAPVAPLYEIELAPQRWAELLQRVSQFDESIRIGRALWRE